jgi:hypothetical protein
MKKGNAAVVERAKADDFLPQIQGEFGQLIAAGPARTTVPEPLVLGLV